MAEVTFVRARLDHQLRRVGKHKVLWEFYREALRLRQELNLLTGGAGGTGKLKPMRQKRCYGCE